MGATLDAGHRGTGGVGAECRPRCLGLVTQPVAGDNRFNTGIQIGHKQPLRWVWPHTPCDPTGKNCRTPRAVRVQQWAILSLDWQSGVRGYNPHTVAHTYVPMQPGISPPAPVCHHISAMASSLCKTPVDFFMVMRRVDIRTWGYAGCWVLINTTCCWGAWGDSAHTLSSL